MKNLMIISFLLLGSCSVSMNEPEDVSRYSFPTEWQGYYTRVSGDRDLPKEFKVSDKYMSYKNTASYADKENFHIQQIESIKESTSSIFHFEATSSYMGGSGIFRFQELPDGSIDVSKGIFFLVETANYTKSTVPR